MKKNQTLLTTQQYYRLSVVDGRRILGRVTQLLGLRKKPLTVEVIRKVIADLYLSVDEFTEKLDEFCKENEKGDSNG